MNGFTATNGFNSVCVLWLGIEFTLPLLEDKKKSRDASEVESSRQVDGEDPAKSGEAVWVQKHNSL